MGLVILVVAATERELQPVRGAETLCCGIGPVEAALQTSRALANGRPDAVLHVGIAGARVLEPLSVVLGSESVYCDLIDAASTMPRIERATPDAALLEAARATLPDAAVMPIGTCGRVGASTGCEVEAMEGFGVLRAAQVAGVPALEVRVVSNAVGEPDRAKWRIADALGRLAEIVPFLVEGIAHA